jgi:deoxyribose-phosphate aldolase
MTAAAAADLVVLVDLTSLNDDDTPDVVRALSARAVTPLGPVAAVCVVPQLTEVAVQATAGTPVLVATVANFPAGDDDPRAAAEATRAAVAAGADEVDVVAPWRAHVAGDHDAVGRLVAACAEAVGDRTLKVILETGSHPDDSQTRAMAGAALDAGAHFLKTSTGKVGQGATPAAARVLLEAVREHGAGGVKVSGGVRTAEQARAYVALADEILGPGWATPQTFRIGASSLLDDLLGGT